MIWFAGIASAAGVLGLGVHVHRTGKRAPRFPEGPLTAVVLGYVRFARQHPALYGVMYDGAREKEEERSHDVR